MKLDRSAVLPFVFLIAFCGSAGLHAGEDLGRTAVVEGRVSGPEGARLPGVTVGLRDGSRRLPVSVLSDSEGRFRLENVPVPGRYQIVCSLGASDDETGPEIELTAADQAASVDVTLSLRRTDVVSVTAEAWTLPAEIPNSTMTRTAEQLHEQNFVNPEDALRYAPSTVIRKRYVGDRNALVGGRSFGTLQPSRALVFLDGYLLSNFLGRFDAPRWNMVTPEAVERVDVLYGPFSAIHAGNSIGTTVVMTERAPVRLDYHLGLTGYAQSFSQYGDEDGFSGGQVSAYVGGRLSSGLWGAVTFNHQDSVSQPMQYYTISANAAGAFPKVAGAATPVTGILYDVDPKELDRAVFGASGGAFDHTLQDSLKLRAGYSFARDFEASVILGGWRNDTRNSNATFLRDTAGREVWEGMVTDGTNTFSVPASAFAASTREETHRQLGATLRSHRASGWNGSLVGSEYRILHDPAHQANNPDPVAANGGPGTVTRRDGTGWNTLEAQASYTPREGDFGRGRHALTFGVHRNAYRLDNVVNDASDWRDTETTLNQRYQGRTQVVALYAQDAWTITHKVKLTLGWRGEWYETTAGEQLARVATCTPSATASCTPSGDGAFHKTVAYPSRSLSGQSPKASVTFTASEHVLLRGSYGRGVRFPNVEELYNGTVTATSVTLSDPELRAESSNAFELSSEMFWAGHSVRASLFHDDVQDAILRQSDNTVTPSVTNVSNQDLVRTSGVELAWSGRDLGVRGLGIEANVAFTRSKVVENHRDPATEGKYWLRVPKARGNLQAAYRPNERWMGSVGLRYSTSAYNDVYNLDANPNVFGGVSRLSQLDLRLSYKPQARIEMAVGLDNVTDQRAYQFHPLPGRTLVLQMRLASR